MTIENIFIKILFNVIITGKNTPYFRAICRRNLCKKFYRSFFYNITYSLFLETISNARKSLHKQYTDFYGEVNAENTGLISRAETSPKPFQDRPLGRNIYYGKI